jgi:hypothetical protein
MSNFLEILAGAQTASQFARDAIGRVPSLQIAIVANIDDPLNMRRIKVAVASKGALIETDWALAMRLIPGYDPPLPTVGTTVLVGAVNDDPHDYVWFGPVINQTNPQDANQADPAADNTLTIPGATTESVGGDATYKVGGDVDREIKGDENHRVDQDLVVECGQTLTLKNDSGASITLAPGGFVTITDAYGRKLIWGAGGGTQYQWDLGGASIEAINVANFSINSKQIATVGAVDSRGDTLVARGW